MKKYMSASFMILLCIALAFACKKDDATKEGKTALEETAKPFTITKLSATPQQGAVEFDHKAHQQRARDRGKTCKTCHHKGKLTEKCANENCHAGSGGEKMVHKRCYSDCHTAEAKAPKQSQCARCHKQ